MVALALLGGMRGALGDGLGFGLFAIVALAVASGLWWFTAWFLLLGRGARAGAPAYWDDHQHRDGRVRGIRHGLDAQGGDGNEAQFGFFGVALALVTWFSGAAICVLIGACAGPGGLCGAGEPRQAPT